MREVSVYVGFAEVREATLIDFLNRQKSKMSVQKEGCTLIIMCNRIKSRTFAAESRKIQFINLNFIKQ